MQANELSKGILQAVAVLCGVFILFWFLYKVQSVLIYIVLAFVVSLIGRPIVFFLKSKLKLRNIPAVVVTMLFIFGILVGLFFLFVPLIQQQSHNLSLLNIEALSQTVEQLYREILTYFSGSEYQLQQQLENSKFIDSLDFSYIPDFINMFLSILGSLSIGLFSVIFISFFLLKDSKLMERSLLAFIPDDKETRFLNSLNKIKNLLSRYFIGLLVQILVLFVIYSAVLLIFGIDNAIVIAFLCALLNIIPYIGPLIGGVLMFLLSMTSNIDQEFSTVILPTTIYVMIGFGIGQLIDNFLSQPLIFSNSVRSHPLEIFLVILIGGLLFGVVGMIAAVPAYTAMKVIAKEFLAGNKFVQRLTQDF